MFTRSIALALTPVAAFALAACGTTSPTESAKPPQKAATASCENVSTSTEPVTVTDAFGRTVTLDKPAEKVAVLEWQQTEDLLTLCVNPVAVADSSGFGLWNSAEKLPAGTTDVGTRQEPNLEALFATDPDLVVVEAYTAEDDILKQLAKYDVPVLATKGADAKDPIKNMTDTFELIAETVGRQEHAAQVVDQFEDDLRAARKTLADRDLASRDFVYFDGYIDGANISLRPFGQGSLVGEIGEELGLRNAWTGKVDASYGLGQTDVEGMTELGAATFFHTGTVDPDGDINAALAKNKVWTSIPAVAEGRTHPFPQAIWTFGGPRSATQMIDAYVDLLTK